MKRQTQKRNHSRRSRHLRRSKRSKRSRRLRHSKSKTKRQSGGLGIADIARLGPAAKNLFTKLQSLAATHGQQLSTTAAGLQSQFGTLGKQVQSHLGDFTQELAGASPLSGTSPNLVQDAEEVAGVGAGVGTGAALLDALRSLSNSNATNATNATNTPTAAMLQTPAMQTISDVAQKPPAANVPHVSWQYPVDHNDSDGCRLFGFDGINPQTSACANDAEHHQACVDQGFTGYLPKEKACFLDETYSTLQDAMNLMSAK